MSAGGSRGLATRPLMSRAEVAETFGRTERSIFNWERRGVLTPIRVGQSVFYRRFEVESLCGCADTDSNHIVETEP